jgi:hypothetical protein
MNSMVSINVKYPFFYVDSSFSEMLDIAATKKLIMLWYLFQNNICINITQSFCLAVLPIKQ